MRSLLDVNVVIALLDAQHVSHDGAIRWFGGQGKNGWASCPITQNGCIRIMSYAAYPPLCRLPESSSDCVPRAVPPRTAAARHLLRLD